MRACSAGEVASRAAPSRSRTARVRLSSRDLLSLRMRPKRATSLPEFLTPVSRDRQVAFEESAGRMPPVAEIPLFQAFLAKTMEHPAEHVEHVQHQEHASHSPFDRKVAMTMAIV